MHLETIYLNLMASKYAHKFILLQKFFHWLLSEIVGAFTLWVLHEVAMLCIFIFHWICPH